MMSPLQIEQFQFGFLVLIQLSERQIVYFDVWIGWTSNLLMTQDNALDW